METDIQEIKDWYVTQSNESHPKNTTRDSRSRYLNRIVDQFKAVSFPHMKHEDWKYSWPEFFFKEQFTVTQKAPAIDVDEFNDYAFQAVNLLVFINGVYSESDSVILDDPCALQVYSLSEAMDRKLLKGPDFDFNGKSSESSFFSTLNKMLVRDGVYIEVGRNAELVHPIQLLHLGQPDSSDNSPLFSPRNVIVLEENSEASVIEVFQEELKGDRHRSYLTNAVTQCSVKPNARLSHIKIQDEGPLANHMASTFIKQANGSQVRSGIFNFGGRWARNSYHIKYDGPHTVTDLFGGSIANEQQFFDICAKVNHLVSDAKSSQLYKYILGKQATGVFNGTVKVAKDASRIDAQQSNHNLLLSEKAKIHSRPQLEILSEDVKCSHGSTIGQLDKEALFFMNSRGIDRNQAKAILLRVFIGDVSEKISNEKTRFHINQLIEKKLSELNIEDDID